MKIKILRDIHQISIGGLFSVKLVMKKELKYLFAKNSILTKKSIEQFKYKLNENNLL